MNKFKSEQSYRRYVHIRDALLPVGRKLTADGDDYEPREFLSDLYAAALETDRLRRQLEEVAAIARSRLNECSSLRQQIEELRRVLNK